MSTHLERKFADLWVHIYPQIDLHSEYKFLANRRFKFDFAHLETKIAIEVQGGIWMARSGHSGGTGVQKDYEKQNLASANGWRIFLLSDKDINDENVKLIGTTILESPIV
jgi:very-short-patch-repair endonuclease